MSEIPPLREDPFTDDPLDSERADWVLGLWHEQDERLRQRDRQVEENIRMLVGQQWIVWSELSQAYVDLSEYLSDDEKRWRHMPVMNRLFLWYVLMHARMTENPPVITWQPGADRIDAELAEVMDPVFKYIWREVGMLEVLDRAVSWLLPTGRVHLKSRIDPTLGETIEARGRAPLSLLGPDGQPVLGADAQPIQREFDDVPLGEDGSPLATLGEDGQPQGMDADPFRFAEGMIDVDVLTCLEVRGEWGEQIPWHRKRYHMHRSLLTPEQAFEAFGVELEPDIRGQEAEDTAILTRLMHGSGLWGSAGRNTGSHLETDTNRAFVSVYELIQKPGRFPGTERTPDSPGGRKTIVTGSGRVIRDGVREAPFKYTSSIRCIDFVNLPGRPQGSSTQEMLNGPSRTRNRLTAQEIQHATLVSNPVRIIDRGSGIKEGQVRNIPGEEILVDREGDTPPFEYAAAPQLGREVAETGDRLTKEIDQLASLSGAQGTPPTSDASGELVKELRFNADRPIAATMKRLVIELARMAEDWRVLIPLMWDQEKVIRVVGDDHISRTITLYPHLFEQGTINAEPEIESMLPEGRGERQERIERMWMNGVWGDPQSPDAINQFLELARFPHMAVASRPGGMDRSTAEQNVGKLIQGEPAATLPIFEWYDHAIHRAVLERTMKSPQYLKLPPEVQQEMVTFRSWLLQAEQAAALNEFNRQLMTEQAAAAGAEQAAGGGGGGAGEPGASDQNRDPTAPTEGRPRSAEQPRNPMEASA